MSLSQASEALQVLHQEVLTCRKCGLHATRTNAVPGTGPCPADVMIVGEAPGFNEDMQGKPFVGAAGKLLDTLLAGIGLRREDVYVTNVLKCRPPQNRDPMPNEAESCSPYLERQLGLIQPKVVLILGRHALERLLPGHGPISRVHGRMVEKGGVKYVALFHPAAALHNASLINDLQRDFDGVRRYLDEVLKPPPPPEPVPEPEVDPEQLTLL
ncbi:MAG: uracil-DNA glycosylase [Chloroflexi bacterium]|nr:MAG: uracil-DNA glycosylase [Chloroflexota bacterium]TME17703.1 MAG: uracil-DNA glycosylase [Chloroflexota bacterium]TME19279.1 MAG: uracil-DNA glycosylase [Chloroflexota bacterium]